jgi:anti-sigma regulatory factor (Ser/Thr protein kinase)
VRRRVVELHTEIPNGPEAASLATQFLDSVESQVPEKVLTDARLVLSEIVVDSYRQITRSQTAPILITLHTSPNRLRVEVTDHRDFDLTAETAEELLFSMRGLRLVDQVTDDWGPLSQGGIWAEFDLTKSET